MYFKVIILVLCVSHTISYNMLHDMYFSVDIKLLLTNNTTERNSFRHLESLCVSAIISAAQRTWNISACSKILYLWSFLQNKVYIIKRMCPGKSVKLQFCRVEAASFVNPKSHNYHVTLVDIGASNNCCHQYSCLRSFQYLYYSIRLIPLHIQYSVPQK